MCIELLTNKFFLLGLLIYCLPTVSFLIYLTATMPQQPGGYYNVHPTEYSPMFEMVFGLMVLLLAFLAFPIGALIGYPYIMIPYFAVAYYLLYRYYKHEKALKFRQT
ncbi:hypothetical protein J7L49_05940 [Candidatus Bathyarchaeota archaeon]|nr:hypothetical protein [Candidatus Bathyarchaeota archaeon]